MIEDKGILIQNIYYMLSYAFKELKSENYSDVAQERFHNVQNLLAAILEKGVNKQIKRGLYKEYINRGENIAYLRGKLNVYDTMKNMLNQKKNLSCDYDELSINNLYNQIIKTAILVLLKHGNLDTKYYRPLKMLLQYFDNVDVLEVSSICWSQIKYHRNNATYEMLINISYLILHDMLQTTKNGNMHILNFTDEIMSKLYERFIREYYRYHYSELKPNADVIKWNITDKENSTGLEFLPNMNTDITLHGKENTLIIDAKYYTKTMDSIYDKHILHTAHLYQIYAYIKNMDIKNTGKISGMMLYAKTNEKVLPECDMIIDGNRVAFKVLDLNCEFSVIRKQLDAITKDYALL